MQPIKFSVRGDFLPWFPRPTSAAKSVPNWYKNLPLDRTGPTLKRCVPFLDAMTCGYLIPLVADVRLTNEGESLCVESRISEPLVTGHMAEQIEGTPFTHGKVLKFINPWLVHTPPGYSTLFLAPMNVPAIPYVTLLSGIVETDSFYPEVHFPFLCTLPAGQRMEILGGTPIAQAIPFRRDDWQSEFGAWDLQTIQQAGQQIAANPHSYRENQWQRKIYL